MAISKSRHLRWDTRICATDKLFANPLWKLRYYSELWWTENNICLQLKMCFSVFIFLSRKRTHKHLRLCPPAVHTRLSMTLGSSVRSVTWLVAGVKTTSLWLTHLTQKNSKRNTSQTNLNDTTRTDTPCRTKEMYRRLYRWTPRTQRC